MMSNDLVSAETKIRQDPDGSQDIKYDPEEHKVGTKQGGKAGAMKPVPLDEDRKNVGNSGQQDRVNTESPIE